MSKHDDVLGHYTDTLAAWPTKLVGAPPTRAMLDTIHKLGARPGKQALANAMGLRPQGVTGSEIVIVCGAPQLNKMRGFVADGLLKRNVVPPRNGHTVYKLELGPKGQTKLGKPVKAEAAPKAEKPKRPRKPKAAPKAEVTPPADIPVAPPSPETTA